MCLWIQVPDGVIEPQEHLLFAHQKRLSRTFIWKAEATVAS